jgi:hypothetical protein
VGTIIPRPAAEFNTFSDGRTGTGGVLNRALPSHYYVILDEELCWIAGRVFRLTSGWLTDYILFANQLQ